MCVNKLSQTAQPQAGPINVTVTVKPQQSMENVISPQQNQMPPPAFYDAGIFYFILFYLFICHNAPIKTLKH